MQAEPETEKAAPKQLHGFELVRQQFVQEYNSQVLMYRHTKTGASSILLECPVIVASLHSVPMSNTHMQQMSAAQS